ncbi:MAG: hypothetical protein J7559_16425, partial [Cohnella sp.]|nr:hypothetical protein [Cohnella sp.]
MFKKLECVCLHTVDIERSLAFYVSMGLTEGWRINRDLDGGAVWTVIGLRFPERAGAELVL